MLEIICFGDSITYGKQDSCGGWVQRLREHLDANQNDNPEAKVQVYNLGISGDTTDGLVARFEPETKLRLHKGAETVFLFAFGANDAAFIPAQNEFRTPLSDFEENFRDVLRQAKQFLPRIGLLTITPILEEVVSDPIQKSKIRLNKYVELYNQSLKNLSEEFETELIDVYEEFSNNDYTHLICSDGLHPSDEGHKRIFQLVRDSNLIKI